MTEWTLGPSGVPPWGSPNHSRYRGSSFRPATGPQVSPPSSERKRPWGEVPAYQIPGWERWPGVSQKVWPTARAGAPSAAFG
jgi:hypothetical protein